MLASVFRKFCCGFQPWHNFIVDYVRTDVFVVGIEKTGLILCWDYPHLFVFCLFSDLKLPCPETEK